MKVTEAIADKVFEQVRAHIEDNKLLFNDAHRLELIGIRHADGSVAYSACLRDIEAEANPERHYVIKTDNFMSVIEAMQFDVAIKNVDVELWLHKNRDVIKARAVEKKIGCPPNTIAQVFLGRKLPLKWVGPIEDFIFEMSPRARIDRHWFMSDSIAGIT